MLLILGASGVQHVSDPASSGMPACYCRWPQGCSHRCLCRCLSHGCVTASVGDGHFIHGPRRLLQILCITCCSSPLVTGCDTHIHPAAHAQAHAHSRTGMDELASRGYDACCPNRLEAAPNNCRLAAARAAHSLSAVYDHAVTFGSVSTAWRTEMGFTKWLKLAHWPRLRASSMTFVALCHAEPRL